MRNLRCLDQSFQEGRLLSRHLELAARFRIRKAHGADKAKSVENRGHLERALHRVTLGVERHVNLIALRLARERKSLDASHQVLELLRLCKIRVKVCGKFARAGDG